MKTNFLNLTTNFFRYLLLTCAILYIVVYLIIVYFRIQYPFELEWIEGQTVDYVMRVYYGQPLYISPSLESVSHMYPPLYTYLSAVVSRITGIGFFPLRLVSFISSLGCFFIIFLIAWKETKSKISGLIASALYAATYKLCDSWFDIARVDSLFLFFLLATIYFVRFGNSIKEYIFAGVLISLSFLTKQTALIISLPIMLYCIIVNKRQAIFFICTAFVIIGSSTLILNHVYNGWYKYYVFDLPGQHSINKEMIFGFWTNYIFPLKIAFIMSVFYMFSKMVNTDKQKFLFYFLSFIGMMGGSWAGLLHEGGFSNVLMPAYSIIAILFGLAFYTFYEFFQSMPEYRCKLLEVFICLVCILQFGSDELRYTPSQFVPTKKDLETGKKFINMLSEIDGEVFLPQHGYLSTMAGKKSYAHEMPIRDIIIKGDNGTVKVNLTREIKQALKEKRFAAIIIDSYPTSLEWSPIDIENYYVKAGKVFESEDVFWPVLGLKTRPEFIYLPKE